MSYVDSNLTPGEQVVYRAELHWGVYLSGLVLLVMGFAHHIWLAPSLVFLVIGHMRRTSTEMAVTNKRLILKRGLLSLKTLEMNLAKVENIGVDQGIFGRLLGFGTIVVSGTGGTREYFHRVAAPLEFRRAVQYQADAAGQTQPRAA